MSYSKAELPDSQTYSGASVILEQKCGKEGVFDLEFFYYYFPFLKKIAGKIKMSRF